MKSFKGLSDGQRIESLVGFYDINRFTAIARKLLPEEVLALMKAVGAMTSDRISRAGGMIAKYIGDACLFAFPDEVVDEATNALVALKEEMEAYFNENGLNNTVTFSLHVGEVMVGKIPPFETWDLMGDAIQLVWSLDRGPYRGQIVITPQVFRRLAPATRKSFHKHTPPIVYLSDRSKGASAG